MASVGNLVVRLSTDNRKLTRGLGDARSTLKSFVGAATAIAAPLAALFTAGKAIEASGTQMAAEKKLAATIRATGGAAGFTADQLIAQAGALQKLTNFGDETIISAEGVLATFKEIKGDVFKDATKAALDMSAVMGTDLQSSIVQIGKALNDPIRGVTALQRVGVTLNDQQREQIKLLTKSGDLMGAQKIILRELQGEFGGSAEAMADPFTQAKNVMADMLETVGFIIRDVARMANEWIDFGGAAQTVANWLKALRVGVISVIAGAEFLVKNWRKTLTLMWLRLQFFNEMVWQAGKFLFTQQIPHVFEFMMDNWRDILFTMFDLATTVFINMGKNIRNTMGGIWDFIKSGGSKELALAWTPLTEGFANTIKQMESLPPRALTALERSLKSDIDMIAKDLGEGMAANIDRRTKMILQDKVVPGLAHRQSQDGDAAVLQASKKHVASAAVELRSAAGFNAIIQALQGGRDKPQQTIAKSTAKSAQEAAETNEELKKLNRNVSRLAQPRTVRIG